ncbi:flavodoxin [Gallaecimonas sp. GXIMD4217]|uniref:flavodoxin n=1 Tax=Gallaecimonas sp. GXIMD4217 TaxID=3131927 RepID=UPI00311AEC6B
MAVIALVYGTVYGAAEQLAEVVSEHLQGAGHQVRLEGEASLDKVLEPRPDALLVITSTTGQGDIPDNLLPFYLELKDSFPLLNGLPFGVISLGDSSYGDTFCGAGRQFDELLAELGGGALAPRLDIDACETLEPEGPALSWLDTLLEKL